MSVWWLLAAFLGGVAGSVLADLVRAALSPHRRSGNVTGMAKDDAAKAAEKAAADRAAAEKAAADRAAAEKAQADKNIERNDWRRNG